MASEQFFLAILDTMWGVDGDAPHWFTINPRNRSGQRLYRLTGADESHLWVTNACPQQVSDSRKHGTPSVEWLLSSFQQMPKRWRRGTLLVCGNIAWNTYHAMLARHACRSGRIRFSHTGPVVCMKHPAARTWTNAEITRVQRKLRALL